MADDLDQRQRDSIVPLRGPGVAAREDDLQAFESYWQGLRRGADLPFRAEIDPRGIEALLGEAFVAEKIAPGVARLRIAGLHLSDLMGMEVRGMPLSALIDAPDRTRLAAALVDLFERPAILRIGLASQGGLRRPPMTGRMVLLPLRSDLGDISRALGCCVTSGTIGKAPRRFSLTSLEISPLDIATAPVGETAPGPAGHDIPPAQDVPLAGERPYLRLVRD